MDPDEAKVGRAFSNKVIEMVLASYPGFSHLPADRRLELRRLLAGAGARRLPRAHRGHRRRAHRRSRRPRPSRQLWSGASPSRARRDHAPDRQDRADGADRPRDARPAPRRPRPARLAREHRRLDLLGRPPHGARRPRPRDRRPLGRQGRQRQRRRVGPHRRRLRLDPVVPLGRAAAGAHAGRDRRASRSTATSSPTSGPSTSSSRACSGGASPPRPAPTRRPRASASTCGPRWPTSRSPCSRAAEATDRVRRSSIDAVHRRARHVPQDACATSSSARSTPTPTRGRPPASSRPTSCSRSWAPPACSASSTTPPTAARAPTTASPLVYGEELGRSPTRRRRHGHRACRPTWPRRRCTASARHELKERVPRARRSAASMVAAIAVTEPDAGSDVAGHPHPGRARRRRVGHQRHEALHHQRHPGRLAVPAGPHVRRGRPPGHEPDRRADRHARASRSAASSTSWASGRRTPPSCRSTTCGCRSPNTIGEIGRGLPAADGAVPERAHDRRVHGGRRAARTPSTAPSTYLQRAQGVRPAAARQPVHPVPAGRAGRRGRPAAPLQPRVRRGRSSPARTPRTITEMASIAKLKAGRLHREVADCVPAVPRRHRLHGGDVDGPLLPRRPPALDRRRRRRGHAPHHRPARRLVVIANVGATPGVAPTDSDGRTPGVRTTGGR